MKDCVHILRSWAEIEVCCTGFKFLWLQGVDEFSRAFISVFSLQREYSSPVASHCSDFEILVGMVVGDGGEGNVF